MASSVTVIIPVHNGERYVAQAIESVLAQTHPASEIIMVDDGSTDGSAQVVKRFGSSVHYAFQPQGGAGSARNRGIQLAQGDFFAFLDADDLWTEDKLELQLAACAADPALDAVFGHTRQFHSPELDDEVKSKTYCPPGSMPGYLPQTMLVRRYAFDRVGLFETNWRVGEFVSWYLRAQEVGLRMLMLPETVHWRRLHETNQGVSKRGATTDYVRILKASLDRRQSTK